MAQVSVSCPPLQDSRKDFEDVPDQTSEIEKAQAELSMLEKLNARLKTSDKGVHYFTFNDDAKDLDNDFLIRDGGGWKKGLTEVING
jgi:hypothetical protein